MGVLGQLPLLITAYPELLRVLAGALLLYSEPSYHLLIVYLFLARGTIVSWHDIS